MVVDTGLMFPTADMLGIDLVLPDFSTLRDRADDIEAIVLTHGHEDHVGALPYVLREIGMPPVIYGGLLTIGMVRSKLDEHKLRDVPLQELPAGEHVRAGPFDIELVHMAHSIPDARAVALTHRARHGAGHRRLQVRPDAGRRNPGGRLAARRARPRGPALPLRRLDQRRPTRGRALGVERRPGAARGLLALPGSHHRHLLRLQHPPRPAGDRRRRPARPPRRPRRPLDAQELQHRLQPRHGGCAGRPLHLAEGGPGLPRREGGRDLDRQPGRAALGAAPDGASRPPRRRASLRRHGDLLRDSDPRQRALGERDDRPDLPDRRPGGHRGRRADPRLRARLAGGAEADAQPDQAAQRLPLPRRPQAAAPARRPRRVGRHRSRSASSTGATAWRSRSTSRAPASARTSTPA